MQIIYFELIVLATFLILICFYAGYSSKFVHESADGDKDKNAVKLRILAFGAGFISLAFMLGLINLYNGKVNGLVGTYVYELYRSDDIAKTYRELSSGINERLPVGKYKTVDDPLVEFSLEENDVTGRMLYNDEVFEFALKLTYYPNSGLYYLATSNLFEEETLQIAQELEISISESKPHNKFGLIDGKELDNVTLRYRLPGKQLSEFKITQIERQPD